MQGDVGPGRAWGLGFHVPRYGVLAVAVVVLAGGVITFAARQATPVAQAGVATIRLARGTVSQTYSATAQVVPPVPRRCSAGLRDRGHGRRARREVVASRQRRMTLSSAALALSLTGAQQTQQSAVNQVAALASPMTAEHAALKITIAEARLPPPRPNCRRMLLKAPSTARVLGSGNPGSRWAMP